MKKPFSNKLSCIFKSDNVKYGSFDFRCFYNLKILPTFYELLSFIILISKKLLPFLFKTFKVTQTSQTTTSTSTPTTTTTTATSSSTSTSSTTATTTDITSSNCLNTFF